MNFLDRVISAVAPGVALRRVTARQRIAAVMNYDAASLGRRTSGWRAPGTSADAAARGSRPRLRNLSRDMIRNRPAAARAQMVVAANVVGPGVRYSVEAASEADQKVIEAVLMRHLGTPRVDALREQTLFGLQTTVMNAVFSDGEVLIRQRLRDRRYEPDLDLPLQLQLIEPDQLDTSVTEYRGNEVREGVEIGPTGRVVAYHMFRDHPGEGGRDSWRQKTERVPAGQMLHIRRQDRAGQLRGVPWLAPVLLTLGELSDYQEAQILKQRMSALMALVVTADENGKRYGSGTLDDLAPGAVVGLDAGQDVRAIEPPSVTGYDEFMRVGLRAIATGIGITYESLSGDLNRTSYTSFRAGRLEMDRLVDVWQREIIVAQFCEGLARWIADSWRFLPQGHPARTISPESFRLVWTPPRRALVEPTKEITGMISAMDAGLLSRQRVQRQLGEDPDRIRRERLEDNEKDAAVFGAPSADTGEET